jgi:hypothetical protein
MNIKMKKVITAAASVIVNRTGDVTTEDGNLATVDIESLLELQLAIVDAFDLDNDDVEIKDVFKINSLLANNQQDTSK